jgi:hypothetical protein
MLRAAPCSVTVLLLTLVLLLLTGCRMEVVAPIALHADGSATAGLSVRFDPRLLAELDALGVDPTAELSAAVAADPAWQLTREREEDGGLRISVTREVAGDDELVRVYDDLTAGLAAEDPALEVALQVDRDERGGATVSGTAAFRPPRTVGLAVDGATVGEDAAALAELVEETVTAAVEVRMPGRLSSHDGVEVDRSTARIVLEPGVERRFSVTSQPPSWWSALAIDAATLLVGAAVLAVVLGAVLLVVTRRRGSVSPEA